MNNHPMWQASYLDRFYPETSWRRNGTREFLALLNQCCFGRILELGAGPSNPISDHLSTLGELHGADVDPAVKDNSALQSAAIIQASLPYESEYFDSCASNYVCEHLDDPEGHLREVWRILKPHGVYAFRTPNKYHYVSAVSQFTPYSFHLKTANKLRGINGHDPYPTHYRMNSAGDIRRLARRAGFKVEEIRLVEREPSYGMSSRALFLLFTAYERIVNSSELFSDLRSNLFVVLRK